MAPLDDAPESDVEEPPVVRRLKEVDDRYVELEKAYEKEAHALLLKFRGLQRPLLEKRRHVLTEPKDEGDAAENAGGTPALSSFWLSAMQHHPAVEDMVQEWDEPVLEFLQDIVIGHADDTDLSKGFTITFHFAENPYIANPTLVKDYRLEMVNRYSGEVSVEGITSTPIEWKEGKDVTVHRVAAKKVKGGGAKKAAAKEGKLMPRPSFFRDFFRTLKPGIALQDDAREMARSLAQEDEDEDEEEDDAQLMGHLMNHDHELGSIFRDNVVPWAVRWYTGEANPDFGEDEDDEDGESEAEAEDDDGSEDAAPQQRPAGKKDQPARAAAAEAPSEGKPGEQAKEECKQQ